MPTNTRDVIRTATCNKCHDSLAFHGGSRDGMDLCIMCHTPQTIDPDTGNTVDMKVMTHKIHMGSELPSVKAGKPYQIIGNDQRFPTGPRSAFRPTRGAASSATSPPRRPAPPRPMPGSRTRAARLAAPATTT